MNLFIQKNENYSFKENIHSSEKWIIAQGYLRVKLGIEQLALLMIFQHQIQVLLILFHPFCVFVLTIYCPPMAIKLFILADLQKLVIRVFFFFFADFLLSRPILNHRLVLVAIFVVANIEKCQTPGLMHRNRNPFFYLPPTRSLKD